MKILIAEDVSGAREYFEACARMLGHEVEAAADGQEAWERYESFVPDLVLTDIHMPRMTGFQLLEKVRGAGRGTIVIIATAHGSEEYAAEALRLGANDYLRKPIRHEALAAVFGKYGKIVAERTARSRVTGMITHQTLTMELENRTELVPQVADFLAQLTSNALTADRQMCVQLGLAEIVTNAIEHGNLGITYEEKTAALKEGTLLDLYARRREDPERAERRVSVEFSLTPTVCEWLVTDDGDGFDYANQPDPLSADMLENEHGRGIFITTFQFDELTFLGVGNQVRLRIHRGAADAPVTN